MDKGDKPKSGFFAASSFAEIPVTARRFGSDIKSWPVIDAAPECPALTDDLSRIIWKGRQWAVTEYGIERCDGKHYAIFKDQLRMHRGKSWIEHMAGKYWVDIPDFTAALGVAFIIPVAMTAGLITAAIEAIGDWRAARASKLADQRRRK